MKKIKNILLTFSILILMIISSSASAEKVSYNAGILTDYQFSGNNILSYAQQSVKNIFSSNEYAEVTFENYPLEKGIEALYNDKISFLTMVPMNDSLSQYVDYTSEPSGIGFLTLLTNSENDIYYDDFESFNNMSIGLIKNSYFENILKEYSIKNKFSYVPVYFDDIRALNDAVIRKDVDAMFTPSTQRPDGMRLIAKCGEFNYYCAVKKGDTQMLNTLNQYLSSLKLSSPFYLYSEYVDNFRIPYRNMSALTDDECTALKNQQKLRILVPADNYPLSFYDEENNEYSGVYENIVEKIAQTAGIPIEYIPYDDYDATLDNIIMGNGDAFLTASGSKQGLITATAPYTSISYIPVSKKDVNVFEDSAIKIGILKNDSWITDYLNETHPQWTIEKYDSINSLLRNVENEKIVFALISSPDMQTKTSLISHPDLSIIGDFNISIPVSLGISNPSCPKRVVDVLNKTIKNMSVPEAELESKVYTLSHIYVPNFRDMIYANKNWIGISLIILAAIVFIAKLREKHFKRLSMTDPLTQIPNRRYFDKNALKLMEKNPNQPYLLATLDARNFKIVNDRFGRIVGDQTIANIALELKNRFKGVGLYARSQSDNFLIFLEDTSQNRELLDKLTDMDIHIHNSSKYQIPIKIGVCPIEKYDPDTNLSLYIDRANIAKKNLPGNGNYIRYFTLEMKDKLNIQNSIEIEMVQALRRGDFIVYYQPKYELKNDTIIGAEALVRWNHKEQGIISPGIFIPLFEKNGFIVDLDFYVYEEVMKKLSERIKMKERIVPVSMNVSRCHLGDNKFVEKLEALVDKYQIPKEYIEMEITESIFSQKDSSAVSLVNDLKKHGFAISMDDFGSGYSSLNLLRKMPIDTLKIDKVFIDNTDNSRRSKVIVAEIIAMSAKIDVKTICEGVETQQQRDFLKEAGCDMVQGYFYSRPLPYNEFEALLNSSN